MAEKTDWDKFLEKAKKVFETQAPAQGKPVGGTPGGGMMQPAMPSGKRMFEDTGKDARSAVEKYKQELEAAKKMDSYKKGGMVKKTGPAKLHKGERVLTVAQAKKPAVKKALKKK